MKPVTLSIVAAGILSLYQIARLPSSIALSVFIALVFFTYIGHSRKSKLLGYSSFFGFLALSAVMGGYYADVKGVGGTLLPEFVVGSVGVLFILLEVLNPPADF